MAEAAGVEEEPPGPVMGTVAGAQAAAAAAEESVTPQAAAGCLAAGSAHGGTHKSHRH